MQLFHDFHHYCGNKFFPFWYSPRSFQFFTTRVSQTSKQPSWKGEYVLHFFLLPFSFPPAPHHHTPQTKWSYRRHWCCLLLSLLFIRLGLQNSILLHLFFEPPSIAPSLMRRSFHSLRSKSLHPPSDNSHNTGEFHYEKRISAREWFQIRANDSISSQQ